jgi:hypothetical protein
LIAVGFLFVLTNTIVDLMTLRLDPRIDLGARR